MGEQCKRCERLNDMNDLNDLNDVNEASDVSAQDGAWLGGLVGVNMTPATRKHPFESACIFAPFDLSLAAPIASTASEAPESVYNSIR